MKIFTSKILLLLIAFACSLPSSAYTTDDFVWDFEWLEPNNKVEIVLGEPYQLQYTSRTNTSLVFTDEYAENWVHYDFNPSQHVVENPTGYSINKNGVITGLVAGKYAIKYTGLIQAKSGTDKWLYITVVSERSENESNNTLDTANDVYSKIRFGLYNTSDVDYFRFTSNNIKWGDYVTFKIHYYGTRESPFGYKWATFSGTDMVGGGSLMLQDQECKALVTSGNSVYLEVYYDQSQSQYFNYGEEFVAEVFINGVPASEYGKEDSNKFEGEGTKEDPYIISKADELINLSSSVNNGVSYANIYFELANDLDISGLPFEAIGSTSTPFSGIFDGKGHSIKGISVNKSSYSGMFGYIDGAKINDLTLEGENIQGEQYIGGIAGYCKNSVITNCHTAGHTMGNDCVGALVGFSGEGTIIKNCYSSIQHTKYSIYGSVGGLVGYNCGLLENSYYYGTINAKIFEKSTTGGLVGYNHTSGSIHYCYFIKYGDVMNGEFNYCGSLNWGDCYVTETFDLYGITSSGKHLYDALNSWVSDNSSLGSYRTWTQSSFPSFGEYAEPVEPSDNKEFVDLGLPSGLLWATTNVGANRPEEYGKYFAWAETTPKAEYSWNTYKYANGTENSLTKYCTSYTYGNVDYKENLDSEDDAATTNWGEPWRTPTLQESQELINYCTWKYTSLNGTYGYSVTGPNGNSIFIPAAGVKQYNSTFYNVTDACLQTATLFNASNGKPSSASVLYIEEGNPHYWYGWSRCWGYTVRPVTSVDPSGVEPITYEDNNEIIAVYDIHGHRISSVQDGINIIKYKNGKTRKIIR